MSNASASTYTPCRRTGRSPSASTYSAAKAARTAAAREAKSAASVCRPSTAAARDASVSVWAWNIGARYSLVSVGAIMIASCSGPDSIVLGVSQSPKCRPEL